MNCPACGSLLKERTTAKGALFLICTRWPACKISGTPELLERFQKPVPARGPVHLGAFITKVAQMRIHQSKLRKAKTAGERQQVRQSALEAMK